MSLDSLLLPWSGLAYRHLPKDHPYSVLDFRFAGRAIENRWNEPDEPTLYLAGDIGVVIAEFARHYHLNRTPALARRVVERVVYRLEVVVDRLLDLRQPHVLQALSLQNAPHCFANRTFAQATARFLRATTSAQALLVPSVAMLDKLERWVLVLFLDKLKMGACLRIDPTIFVRSATVEGPLRWEGYS